MEPARSTLGLNNLMWAEDWDRNMIRIRRLAQALETWREETVRRHWYDRDSEYDQELLDAYEAFDLEYK